MCVLLMFHRSCRGRTKHIFVIFGVASELRVGFRIGVNPYPQYTDRSNVVSQMQVLVCLCFGGLIFGICFVIFVPHLFFYLVPWEICSS